MVVNGHAQQYGMDYLENYVHFARLDTIRLLMAIGHKTMVDTPVGHQVLFSKWKSSRQNFCGAT